MKNVLIFVLMLFLMAGVMWAEGQQEVDKPVKFAMVADPVANLVPGFADWEGTLYADNIIRWFEEETGIKIELRLYSDTVDNTAKSLDMDLASGDPSDVIFSYAGRVNKFANADFGVNLYEALPKEHIEQYTESSLEQFERDGKLYALPMPGWAVCLVVNVDLFEQAGVADVLPADDDPDRSWTVAEFDRAVKAISALGDDYYGYYLIAKECGGDYWVLNMLGGFGADLYKNGKVGLNTPEGLAGMEYIHYLHENGYVPYGATGLFDGDKSRAGLSGKLGVEGGVASNVLRGEYAARDGIVDAPFKNVIMEYPHVEGIDGVGPCFGPDLAMVIDNDDPEQLEKALLFLEYFSSARIQSIIQEYFSKYSPLKTAELPKGEGKIVKAMQQMVGIIQERGIYDMGIGFPCYDELRQIWLAVMQGMLINKITPQEAILEFERRGNKLIAE